MSMASKSSRKASSVRASITFDPERYTQMQKVANEKRVSVAWVVRAAIEQYLRAEDRPRLGTIANGARGEAWQRDLPKRVCLKFIWSHMATCCLIRTTLALRS
ncbi:conserved hypothetical protein [Candidatus Sulfopaludibacter sp. SbA6]|nr:conserved hypothetical protein [Candidatus Sulfopaludibacter sp. SbA6]